MIAITKGSIDQTLHFMLRDSTTGQPKTGYTIANLDLQYTRARSTPAAKVDLVALAATNTAHTDNRAIELDATSSPGVYRVDLPDAAFASGVDSVVCVVSGSGVDPAPIEVSLTGFDLQTATQPVNVTQWLGVAAATPTVAGVPEVDVTHWIGTAAATPTVGGVPEVDITHLLGTAWEAPATAGRPDVNVKAISTDTTAADNCEAFFDTTGYAGTNNVIPTVTTVNNLAADSVNGAALATSAVTEIQSGLATAAAVAALPTAAGNADAVWDEARSGHVTAGTFGQAVKAVADDVVVGAFQAAAIDAAAFASGAITSDAIGLDAIGAAEFAASAATEIAAAVWDKLRSAHTTAGTFGEGAASVQGNVTGSVGSIGTNGITNASIQTGAISSTKIADATITAPHFAVAAIESAALAGSLITAAKIAPDAIGASELAADAVTEIVTALLDTATVELLTVRQALALILAAEAGKTSGAATTTFVVKGADNNTTRISATVDADGNRTAVTLTPP